MSPTTQYIIEGIVAFVLIGIIGYILVQVFGGGGGGGGGNGCPPQTPISFQGNCYSCDPTSSDCQTCNIHGSPSCQNGGTCNQMTTNGNGVCACKPPFFGKNCENICSTTVPCKNNGTCVNGKCQCPSGFGGPDCSQSQPCTSNNCQLPGCNISTCACNPGFANDPNNPTGEKCTICAPGYGGPNCSQKEFTVPIVVGTQSPTAFGQNPNWECQQDFGPAASYAGTACTSGLGQYLACNIPGFIANSNFDINAWNANNPTIAGNECNITYCGSASYDKFRQLGGVPQGPSTPRNPICTN